MKNFLITSLFFALLLTAGFKTEGQNISQLGPNYFVAGVTTNEFQRFAAPKRDGLQRQSNWCWAACVQMVLNFHGLKVNQEQIVRRVYGNNDNQPAGLQQILYALSGWAPNVHGGRSSIFAESGIMHHNEITQNLSFNWPLIVGLTMPGQNVGHAYVLTAIYYSTDMYNNTIPDKVVLRDPMPGNRSRIEMSWREFSNRCNMIVKVRVSR